VNVSDEQAEELLQYWVKILRLGHWDIDIVVLDEAEYVLQEGNESNAKVKICSTKLSAHIFINDASEDEINYLIVHELVHIMMDPLECIVHIHADKGRAGADFRDGFDDHLELLTHAVARAIIQAHKEKPVPYKKVKR
jgi:Zn-dependent peptidase ImmA (M78 family)